MNLQIYQFTHERGYKFEMKANGWFSVLNIAKMKGVNLDMITNIERQPLAMPDHAPLDSSPTMP